MFDPEFSDGRIRTGKRKPIFRLFMREISWIKIQSHSPLSGKINPFCKMLRLYLVTVYLLSFIIQIDGMRRYFQFPRYQLKRSAKLSEIFRLILRFTAHIPRSGDPSCQSGVKIFESCQIVDLPAMHGYRYILHLF